VLGPDVGDLACPYPRLVASRVKEDLSAAEARLAAVLQDGTLQGLVAARTMLTAGLRHGSPEALEGAATAAVRQIDDEIAALRGLLAESHPDQVVIRPRPSA
jgi:hypothetical protein